MCLLRLEKWLSCYKCLLLFQRTGAEFPAPRSGSSQAPMTPASGDLTCSLALLVLYTGSYIPTDTQFKK